MLIAIVLSFVTSLAEPAGLIMEAVTRLSPTILNVAEAPALPPMAERVQRQGGRLAVHQGLDRPGIC